PTGLPTSYSRVANKLVKPHREMVVEGGRWSLAFHNGSLSVKKVVSIDQASDGTVRAQLAPGSITFSQAADLTVSYAGTHMAPSAAGYVVGSAPVFFHYDALSRKWVQTASTNDVAHRQLHVRLTQLGVYGVGSGTGW